MERSPRGAGVRAPTAASMGHYTLRSFVISLAIAITINKSPVSGFTIARDMLDLTPDMDTGESKLLEVKYDLKTLNDDDTIKHRQKKEDLDSTVTAITNLEDNDKLNYSNIKVNEIHPPVNETTNIKTMLLENNKIEMPFDTTTIISTETDSNFFTTSAPSDTQTTTTEQNDSAVSGTTEDNMSDKTLTTKPDTYSNNNNSDSGTSENPKNDLNNMIQNAVPTPEYISTVLVTTIVDTESATESDISDQKVDKTTITDESTIAKNGSPEDLAAEVTTEVSTKTPTEVTIENSTDDNFSTSSYSLSSPPWKKYTSIDRKPTTTKTSITTDKDMVLAETAQTRISLETMFTTAPSPEINTSVATDSEAITSPSNTNTDDKTETTKLEIVSKRAGFKDKRDNTSKPVEVGTELQTGVSMSSTKAYDISQTSSAPEDQISEAEVSNNKTASRYGSQSQLAEDAIKEELLREEMLNDNEEYAKFKHGAITEPEDMLSVKPIGQEKKKQSILYTVNPNYKPLKKIDVQPPKPFVRDPDDNSWRNESISSLGIVFKPKNASKSFTEVLKNKTESVLSNVSDKDSKGDVPDLRDRLEKIAEVRKSKKRINKFGDTVYSDYEESSENANPFKEFTTTPMTTSVESITTITPTPQSLSPTKEADLSINAITKGHLNIFKSDKVLPVTTIKPHKKYNLAEYYDASDDYDSDYVNQHKIDLKKFTKTMPTKEEHATQPPELLYTPPTREYQPMRVATLQYFPPTTKIVQKVNMNDYDSNFNRKVNLYSFNKPPPKPVLTTSFGTVSPISTVHNDLTKVTLKPAYTPMYQSDNLDKNLYLTNQQRVPESPHGELLGNDGNYNRASYVIKHYRDFLNEAAKEGDEERNEYPFTEAPLHGITVNELTKLSTRESTTADDDYEYDTKFRKDIMNRFVENFNQNSERFKVTFPILYNSSVVHRQTPENGRVASSSAFMKRLYEPVANPRTTNYLKKPCDPHCEKTVELSPAYELHYYVPDEEEKEEIQPQSPPPYRYRL